MITTGAGPELRACLHPAHRPVRRPLLHHALRAWQPVGRAVPGLPHRRPGPDLARGQLRARPVRRAGRAARQGRHDHLGGCQPRSTAGRSSSPPSRPSSCRPPRPSRCWPAPSRPASAIPLDEQWIVGSYSPDDFDIVSRCLRHLVPAEDHRRDALLEDDLRSGRRLARGRPACSARPISSWCSTPTSWRT